MPEPEGAQVFMFPFPREENLETLVEIIRPLRIQQITGNFPHLRHVLQEAAVYGNKSKELFLRRWSTKSTPNFGWTSVDGCITVVST